MSMFLPLFKAEEANQTIWARAASEEPDKSREIMDYVSARPQFELWSQQYSDATMGKSLGNVRAMHNPRHLAGKIQEIVYNDEAKSIDVCLKILDPVDWAKVKEGGYTGLSIGGGYVRKWADTVHAGHTRYTPRIGEISLVDAPCMPGSRFLELQKRDGSVEEIRLVGHPRTFAEMQPPASFDDLHKGLGSAFEATRGLVGRVANHPVVAVAQGALKATKTVKDVAALGSLAAGAVGGTGVLVHHQRSKDRLAMPAHMKKGVAGALGRAAGAVGERLGATTAGKAVGRAAGEIKSTGWKGAISPVHTLARAGAAAAGGSARAVNLAGHAGLAADYAPVAYTAASVTGVLPGDKPKKDLALPAHMQKSAPEVFLDQLNKAGTLPIEGQVKDGNNLVNSSAAMKDNGETGGPIDQNLRGELTSKSVHHGDLSSAEHAQRIAAAKARWMKEGHHDLDTHLDAKKQQASKAFLGRANKVAAVEHERHNTWSAVADTHAAYDKVRAHLPKDASLMMEVPHQGGLVYNPEGVGEHHFDATGQAKHALYMLHPAEADDWIAKHGTAAKAVTKMAPRGRIGDIRTFAAVNGSGRFAQAAA